MGGWSCMHTCQTETKCLPIHKMAATMFIHACLVQNWSTEGFCGQDSFEVVQLLNLNDE